MIAGTSAVRSEDISTLKDAVLVYTTRYEKDEKLDPPIKFGASKAGTRGHHHIQLSRAICPAIFEAEFDLDPRGFNKKLLRGKILIRARDWPSFFWPRDGYDPDNILDGLLRNPVLILVCLFSIFSHYFTHIF